METNEFEKEVKILDTVMELIMKDENYHRYLTSNCFHDYFQTIKCGDEEHLKILKILNDFFETECDIKEMIELCADIIRDLDDVWVCWCEQDEIDDCECSDVWSEYGYIMFVYNILKFKETGGYKRYYNHDNWYTIFIGGINYTNYKGRWSYWVGYVQYVVNNLNPEDGIKKDTN